MDLFETTYLTEGEVTQLLSLWNQEYPQALQYPNNDGLCEYLNKLKAPRHVLYKDSTGALKAWYCDFLRKDQRWFAMILHRESQGKGLGSQMLQNAKSRRSHLNGWVILENIYLRSDGAPYPSPAAFYLKNDFLIHRDTELLTSNFSAVKIEWKKAL